MMAVKAPKTIKKTIAPSFPIEVPPELRELPEERDPPPPPPPLLWTAPPEAKKVFGGSVRRLYARTFPGTSTILRIVCGERRRPSKAYTVSPSARASTVLYVPPPARNGCPEVARSSDPLGGIGKETSLVVDEDAGCEKNTPSVHDKVIRNRFSGDSADGEHGDAPKAVPLPEEEEVARLNPAGSPEDACTGGKRMGRRRNDRPPGERKLDRLSGLDPGRRDDPALPETALLDDDHGVPR